MRYPVLQHIARQLCDTPQKQAPNSFAILSLQASRDIQGPLNGGVSNGGVSRSGLVTCPSCFVLFCPFLSFLGLSRFFRDFPNLSRDSSGIFLICPFPLSRPTNSAYEEQSRKGPRHNLDLSRKMWETPRFGNPPRFSFSQDMKSIAAGPLRGIHFQYSMNNYVRGNSALERVSRLHCVWNHVRFRARNQIVPLREVSLLTLCEIYGITMQLRGHPREAPIASEWLFFALRRRWARIILSAEIPCDTTSVLKIAREWRCAIVVRACMTHFVW